LRDFSKFVSEAVLPNRIHRASINVILTTG
jgi:hypothetical protein